jgi:hypothetical protein
VRQSEEINNQVASSPADRQSSIRSSADLDADEYISADEETTDSPLVSSVAVDAGNKAIIQLLHRTHALIISVRKLIKIMRNIGVVDHYVRHFPGGPPNGFVIDIEVK